MKQKYSQFRGCLNWAHVLAPDPVSSDHSTSMIVKRRAINEGPWKTSRGQQVLLTSSQDNCGGCCYQTGTRDEHTREVHVKGVLSPPLKDVGCWDLGPNWAVFINGGIRVSLSCNIIWEEGERDKQTHSLLLLILLPSIIPPTSLRLYTSFI